MKMELTPTVTVEPLLDWANPGSQSAFKFGPDVPNPPGP
jgi:hypothetical protein